MSYTRIWCLRSESNQRHVDFQSTALPTELQRHIVESFRSPLLLATRNGLEPSTSSVTGWRANRLHHRAKYGGNNRARTCDLLLVRQMLSQLSYAPKSVAFVLRTSETWFIIHIELRFVKHFFSFFSEFFRCPEMPRASGKYVIFSVPIPLLLPPDSAAYPSGPAWPKPGAGQSRNHGCLR